MKFKLRICLEPFGVEEVRVERIRPRPVRLAIGGRQAVIIGAQLFPLGGVGGGVFVERIEGFGVRFLEGAVGIGLVGVIRVVEE